MSIKSECLELLVVLDVAIAALATKRKQKQRLLYVIELVIAEMEGEISDAEARELEALRVHFGG